MRCCSSCLLAAVAVVLFMLVGLRHSSVVAETADRAVYYLALGDSLAVGVGAPEGEGYADSIFTSLLVTTPTLQLENLACSGERTATMLDGQSCSYPHGSQLDEAVAFLDAHPGAVVLVTLTIGANDVRQCSLSPPDLQCLITTLAALKTNLESILGALREAAGPEVPLIGMTYYNPYLAFWLDGAEGRASAVATTLGTGLVFNPLLETVYRAAGALLADVAGAFSTTKFRPQEPLPDGEVVPFNVARICQWTLMCEQSDIHANAAGHGVIAEAFLEVLRSPQP